MPVGMRGGLPAQAARPPLLAPKVAG